MGRLYANAVYAWSRCVLLGLLGSGLVLLVSPTVGRARAPTTPMFTQLELQSELMSFADTFSERVGQSITQPTLRRAEPLLFRDTIHAVVAVFTIAAAPNPGTGLLDMVALTTLGRMIYEEHWQKQLGQLVQPLVADFRTLEAQIWRLAAKVLTPDEQRQLRDLIRIKRQRHPQQVAFAFIRFGDFSQERHIFTLAETKKARGLFKSVQQATQKVDEVRLLAERGIYLGTRVPLTVGLLIESWLAQWLVRPELVQLRGDVTQVSEAVDRAVRQVEQLPNLVEKEREAAIRQLMAGVEQAINLLMDRVAHERQQLMQGLVTTEDGGPGVLPEIEQTLVAGNALAPCAVAQQRPAARGPRRAR